jgi:hypothetical protein
MMCEEIDSDFKIIKREGSLIKRKYLAKTRGCISFKQIETSMSWLKWIH